MTQTGTGAGRARRSAAWEYRASRTFGRTVESAVVSGLAILSAFAISHDSRFGLAVLGALLAVGVGVLAIARPRATFLLAIWMLVFIPYYAAPTKGPLLLLPCAVVFWIVALAKAFGDVASGRRIVLSLLDAAVLALIAAMSLSVFFGHRTFHALAAELFLWVGAYLAGRLVVRDDETLAWFARTVVLSALALTPFVLVEATTGLNPFHRLHFNAAEASVWLPTLVRFNDLRAEASFGHPIALSIFLASASILSLGFALRASRLRGQATWAGAAIFLAIVQAVTLSRTGWLVTFAGVLVLAVQRRQLVARPRFVLALAVLIGIAITAAPAAPVRNVIYGTFVSSASADLSGPSNYRRRILEQAREPGVLKYWGNREPKLLGSVDNEYLFLADRWGLVAAGALGVLSLLVIGNAVLWRGPSVGATVLAVAAANLVGLAAVAFVTQQQVWIWLISGVASAMARRSESTWT